MPSEGESEPTSPDPSPGPSTGRGDPPAPPPPPQCAAPVVPYAELHCHSNLSFLDGASSPEQLVEEAARLGIETLGLTDHDGLYGVVRFARAAREAGVGTVFGAELSIGASTPRQGEPDPGGEHLVVLARDPQGYASLSRALSIAQLAGEKGRPWYGGPAVPVAGRRPDETNRFPGVPVPQAGRPVVEQLAEVADGHWMVLTGCRKGPVLQALTSEGPAAARRSLRRLVHVFGRDNVAVELVDHADPMDGHRNDALARIAVEERVEVVVSNNVHFARPSDHRLAGAMAAIRSRRSLEDLDGWLPVSPAAHLRAGAEQARRFRRFPGVVQATAALGRLLRFDLQLVVPELPGFDVPDGHTPMSWLRELTEQGARHRYGSRDDPEVPGAWGQIDHELGVIEQLDYPGYFLIVRDLVEFCVSRDILCQGRGSAANSAVCFVLGITRADAVRLGLLFERFLSPHRDGPPDIDLDIESSRREEVIQYVYARYGRMNAAQVANVITYRPRSAIRDAARALGHSRGQIDAWTRQVPRWSARDGSVETDIPADVRELATRLEGAPRHLGVHSGGMVLCSRPVVEVCPVEHARMEGRTVLQWDKDDCADAGLVKFDLLGLGMLSALHDTVDLVEVHEGTRIDLAALPQQDEVYDMLCRGDAIGVFQVESRAQLATLPRLRPRTFQDLVVEVAIIRPGPIQGGSVHPYIRRRNGEEPVTHLHPLLERSLARTLGVPLFQEQLMQMAVDVAGLSAAEADELRQAMGAKRSAQRMERLRGRLFDGMAERGVDEPTATRIFRQIEAFADFGFPESHAISFAYLVYASAWLKLHHPAAFLAGLLDNQPMGFWSPQSLVADARRHGVVVRSADVNHSGVGATLEVDDTSTGGLAVRLGLSPLRDVGTPLAERIVAGAPHRSMEDVVRTAQPSRAALESLATAGAFASVRERLDGHRREDLWTAGAVVWQTPDRLAHTAIGANPPPLVAMTAAEEIAADLWTAGVSTTGSPMDHLRGSLEARGVLRAVDLDGVVHGRTVRVAGVVTHRQQPSTANGTVFVNLEDETGMTNVICAPWVWEAHRAVATSARALLVLGQVERAGASVNVVARRLELLPLDMTVHARDFR
ncbi:MAG: error-prone DNA polymerase [Nitriliruptoraceae bacterium]